MDVYSQQEQRAHGTGFVGIEAESEDAIDNLEVYEALINPRESERGAGGQGGGMMPPPMMGMGGAGASSGAAAGASSGMAASAGIGSGASTGALGGGASMPSGPLSSGPVAAGLPADESVPEVPEPGPVPEGEVPRGGAVVEQEIPVVGDTVTPGVTSVDPAQVEQAAREWSSLASEMAEISATAGQLQASLEDFGLVQQPAGPYGEVSSGIRELAGGASREFDQIASGLNYGAQAYRDQEAQAAQSVRSAQ